MCRILAPGKAGPGASSAGRRREVETRAAAASGLRGRAARQGTGRVRSRSAEGAGRFRGRNRRHGGSFCDCVFVGCGRGGSASRGWRVRRCRNTVEPSPREGFELLSEPAHQTAPVSITARQIWQDCGLDCK